jgi:hypothetical protein
MRQVLGLRFGKGGDEHGVSFVGGYQFVIRCDFAQGRLEALFHRLNASEFRLKLFDAFLCLDAFEKPSADVLSAASFQTIGTTCVVTVCVHVCDADSVVD